MTRTNPATAPARAVPEAVDPVAPADGGHLLPDADEGDAHRPGDSVGVPAPFAALFPSVEGPARPRTAP